MKWCSIDNHYTTAPLCVIFNMHASLKSVKIREGLKIFVKDMLLHHERYHFTKICLNRPSITLDLLGKTFLEKDSRRISTIYKKISVWLYWLLHSMFLHFVEFAWGDLLYKKKVAENGKEVVLLIPVIIYNKFFGK